jgi:hypothetical protein
MAVARMQGAHLFERIGRPRMVPVLLPTLHMPTRHMVVLVTALDRYAGAVPGRGRDAVEGAEGQRPGDCKKRDNRSHCFSPFWLRQNTLQEPEDLSLIRING